MKTTRPPAQVVQAKSEAALRLNRGAIRGDEVLLVDEACRRFGLKRHSRRQLRRLGLRIARFGSKDFTTGEWFKEFLDRLAEQQAEDQKD